MDQIFINQLAVGVLLLVTAFVGLFVKSSKTVKGYILASRSLGTGVLTMTLIATMIEVCDIEIETPFKSGFVSLLPAFGCCFTAVLLGQLVFPRLAHSFKDCYTVSQVMGKMYGSTARIITVLLATFFSLSVIVVQLVASGEVASLLGLKSEVFICIISLTMTVYTMKKGMRGVAITDILQLGLLLIGVIMFTTTCLSQFGGLHTLFSNMPSGTNHLSFWNYPYLKRWFLATFFWYIWPTFFISPHSVQRILMVKKPSQVKSMFLGFATLHLFIRILFFLVGLCFFKNKDRIIANFSLNNIINNCYNPFLKCYF